MAGQSEEVTNPKPLVLDANILIRSVLGSRARHILALYRHTCAFYVAGPSVADARRYLPGLGSKHETDLHLTSDLLEGVLSWVEIVDEDSFAVHQQEALARIGHRDPDDWPIIATALLLNAPIWTEDQDFFGCGIATWITATVDLYLRP